MIVSDEATAVAGQDWPKLVWVVDVQDETNPVPLSTFPIPPVDEFKGRGGRYGAHNLHENRPVSSNMVNEKIIFGTFFNGGVRAYDVSNPFRPEEVAYYVPEAPRGSKAGATQINDVLVDERGIVYAVDRLIGGSVPARDAGLIPAGGGDAPSTGLRRHAAEDDRSAGSSLNLRSTVAQSMFVKNAST